MVKVQQLEEKRSNTKLVWIFVGIAFAIYLVILILVKMQIPSFSIGKVLIWIFVGLIICSWVGIGFQYFGKKKEVEELKEKEEIPKACTKSEAFALAKKILESQPYADYLDENTIERDSVEELGQSPKTSVYTLIGKGVYKPRCTYAVLLNMHVPLARNTVLINANSYEIGKYKQLLTFSPEMEPEKEIILRENAILGTKESIEKITPVKEKKEEDKKKEDLV